MRGKKRLSMVKYRQGHFQHGHCRAGRLKQGEQRQEVKQVVQGQGTWGVAYLEGGGVVEYACGVVGLWAKSAIRL